MKRARPGLAMLSAVATITLCAGTAQAQTISGVSPATGRTVGGIQLTIVGNNFGTMVGSVTVGTTCPVAAWSNTTVLCQLPAGQGAGLTVDVSTGNGRSATLANGFSYLPPVISSISPTSGVPAGGNVITLTGDNFGTGAGVTALVGVASATVVQVSHTQMQVRAPPGSGTENVSVLVAAQLSNTVPYTYLSPAIFQVSPATGRTAGGDRLTLTGENFTVGSTVTVGASNNCPVLTLTSTAVECILPEGTGAGLTVSINALDGSVGSLVNAFSYLAPVVTSVSPANGGTLGGGVITITGDNFGASGASVALGMSACPLVSQTHTDVLCRVPEGAGAGLPVSVVVASQPSSGTATYSYDPPTLNTISPDLGPTSGGGVITLSGSNFGPPASPVTVSVGTGSCSGVQRSSHSQLTCMAPAGQGSQPVGLTVAAQPGNLLSAAYQAPAISSVTATAMPTAGNVPLTITGTSFGLQGASVLVGTAPCAVTSQDHTRVVCTLPEGEGEGLTLRLAVDGVPGNSGTVSYDPPVINQVTPSAIPTAGAVPLTIRGENFGLTPSVGVGLQACPLTQQSHVELVCTAPEGAGASVPVVVSVVGRQSNTSAVGYLAPQIASVSPTSGAARGGTVITLNGSNFGASGATVQVAGNDCALQFQSHTSALCTTPPGTTGPAPVTLTVGQQGSAPAVFTYTGPTLDALIPSSVPQEGGLVLLTGQGFAAGMEVRMDSGTCTLLDVQADQALCQMGAGTGQQLVSVCVNQSCSPQLSLTRYPTCGNVLSDGQDCDDGNPCTDRGVCQGTVCVPGQPAGEGTACRDGNVCLGTGTCASGTCQAPDAREGLTCDAAGNTCMGGLCGNGGSSSSSGGAGSSSGGAGSSSGGAGSSSGGAGSSSGGAGSSSGGAGSSSGGAGSSSGGAGSSSGGAGSSSGGAGSSSGGAGSSSGGAGSSSGGAGSSSSGAASDNGGGGGDSSSSPSTCTCTAPGATIPGAWLLVAVVGWVVRRRRR